jgi:uncharacterized protein (DUF983 family)
MSLERIGNLYDETRVYKSERTTTLPCFGIDHRPDTRGLSPGKYKHTCPKCGEGYYFEVLPQGAFL